jgi:hypothetical protein
MDEPVPSNYPAESFELLADPVRSRVLVELAQRDGPVDRWTLAVALAEAADEEPVRSAVGTADPADLATELHHRHLPKLAAAGWVDYAADAGQCRLRDDELAAALEAVLADLDRLRNAVE